jgi:hypothetical protein
MLEAQVISYMPPKNNNKTPTGNTRKPAMSAMAEIVVIAPVWTDTGK